MNRFIRFVVDICAMLTIVGLSSIVGHYAGVFKGVIYASSKYASLNWWSNELYVTSLLIASLTAMLLFINWQKIEKKIKGEIK